LSAREEQLLFALLLTPVRAFQVMEPPGPGGMLVKDVLTGAEAVSGCLGLPDGLIRSDACVGRLLPFGRLRRPGISLLRFPPGSQGELWRCLSGLRISQPAPCVVRGLRTGGVSVPFFLDRGRELGGPPELPMSALAVGRVRYRAVEVARIAPRWLASRLLS
jgi:hypothetical protein